MKNIVNSFRINTLSSRKGLGVGLTCLFLTLGVGQMWGGPTFSGGYAYFYNKGGWTDAYKQLCIGKSSYTSCYSMTAITNTKLWYNSLISSGWGDATYMAVIGNSSAWGDGGWGTSNLKNANHRTASVSLGDWGFGSGNVNMLTPANGNNDATLTLTYIGNAYTSLNLSQTFKVQVSTDGGSSYSNPSTSPLTISFSSKTFSNYTTCGTNSTGSVSGTTVSNSKNAGYTATTTLSYSSLSSDYDFVCWHDGSSSVGTGTSYTYYPTAATTITARVKLKQFTVSYGVCSTTRNGSIKLNSGSAVTTTSSATLNKGTSLSFTASPNSGYQVEGWYSDASCTAGNRLQSRGTSYDAGTLTAAKTVYVKFEAKTGGILTLNAGTGGQVSTDNSTWGSTKYITDITTATTKNIYARANDGYVFSSWAKSSGSGTLASTSSASTTFTTVAYEDATLTASFAAKTNALAVSSSSLYAGDNITLTATRTNHSLNLTYQYKIGSGAWTDIATQSGTSKTWQIPYANTYQTYKFRVKSTDGSVDIISSEQTVNVKGRIIIHVKNTNSWALMYLYSWYSTSTTTNGAWPGTTGSGSNEQSCTIHATGSLWWDVTITQTTTNAQKFILNCNTTGDANQTNDLSLSNYTHDGYYAIGTESGKKTLTTTDAPTAPTSVTTTETPTSITNSQMTVHGNIGGNGNDNITDYGFYYGTTSSCGTKAQVGTSNKTGAISKTITSLTPGQTYYFKTYATNGQGTTYGDVQSYKIPYKVTISKSTGCQSITPSAGSYYYNAGFTVTAVAATGYNFSTWTVSGGSTSSPSSPSTGTNTVTFTPTANNATITATYTPKTTSITLSQTGAATTGSVTTRTGTYNAAMPAITGSGSLPIAPNGYCFMGYYGSANGEGTKYYNADGSSAHTWDQVGATATLYAYFKKAEITVAVDQSIFSPVDAGGESWVTATPTVDPTPVAPTRICWALLYDDENPVPSGHDPVELADNKVKFNLAGLAAGNYKIRATLRTGSSCAAGTLLSTYDKTITIATNFKVTVRYMCGDEAIKDTIMVDAHATSWTDISAPNITGYEFSTWDLGDGGLTTDKALTLQSGFRFKATYNGVLTAVYTKQKYIYLDLSQTFSESGKWNTPYCYLYNSTGDWNDGTGVGATSANCVKKGAMSQIAGTDIWYYDYSNASAFIDAGNNGKVAFTWGNKTTYGNFCDDVIYRGDFSEGTPLFIPAVGQSKVEENSNCAKYYNAGYWTNYVGAKTGYTLSIYNSAGDAVVKEQPFTSTSNDMRMTMKATVDLEAATTYQVEIRRDNGHYYKNNSARDYSNSQVNWEYREDLTKGSLITTAAGDYVFTLSYTDYSNDKNFQVRMKVDYPATTNDFQVMYNDNATWSLGTTHGSGWRHPSRIITARAGGIDTISFFVAKGNSPRLYARKVNSINASTGVITWANINAEGSSTYKTLSVDSSAVYNFKVIQGAAGVISSIVNIGAYTGDYYIRCDAMNSKWDNYTSDGDHRMTYSSFSESTANAFGEKFSHYKAKWCKYGKNVKFVIANDYSPCISDTLTQDVPNTYNNIDAHGFLKSDGNSEDTENIYSANIRFMWNRKTNKISRAYVASSTNPERLFLVLRGNYEIQGEDRAAIEDEGSGKPSVILQDDQNWIYEEVLYIKPGTRFKLYACYAQASANPNGAQYFRGAYESGAWAEDDTKSVILIDGSGDYQKARVLYDFKTNRLICAWLPSDTAVSGTLKINADVMIIREHQEAAQYLSFADADSKLTGVKTVYGVMKFNRCVLNNRQQTGTHLPLDVSDQKSIFERSLYFISFPFDVRVSDIFGFGQYGVHWILEYYDGLTRAKNGFWIDSPPNWKYVMPSEATSFVLKANEGYILALDLDQMKYNNTDFWPNDIQTVELFFPSTAELETLKQTTCTIPALSSDYKCTINRTGEDGDRRVKDSYWRCIGTPSLNLYNTAVKDGSGNTIAWKTDYTWHEDEREFPFIYMWNKADNTLTPQSTSTFRFLPMHSYLVQNGGKIVWTNISAKSSSIVSRRENDYQQIDYNWRLELAKDSQMVDQAYIRMSNLEQVTDTFDFGQDLSKEFNATRSNIYSFIGYEKAAANSMPLKTEQTTIVAIGLNIITAGEYTLGMPDGTDGVGVTLVDSETGTRTNLSAGMTYTLTLAAGDYTSRFYLEISPVKETPTGLEQLPTTNDQSPIKKLLIDGILYIIRDGKIFDARGVMVK